MSDRLYNLKFEVEVSARYHDWRRSFLQRWLLIVRLVSAVGAVLSLVALSAGKIIFLGFSIDGVAVVTFGAMSVAIVNIIDFVVRADDLAIRHTDLYRRFKALQARVTRYQKDWEAQIDNWEADAQAIREDEPPTMWALYMLAWNQAAERRDPDAKAGVRVVTRSQKFLKNLRQYLPRDFPAGSA